MWDAELWQQFLDRDELLRTVIIHYQGGVISGSYILKLILGYIGWKAIVISINNKVQTRFIMLQNTLSALNGF